MNCGFLIFIKWLRIKKTAISVEMAVFFLKYKKNILKLISNSYFTATIYISSTYL